MKLYVLNSILIAIAVFIIALTAVVIVNDVRQSPLPTKETFTELV